jgi:6,7-dimethyl-8-ribityllumazine synthase
MLDMHIMLVQSTYNRDITDQLFSGAIAVLDKVKATYEHYLVPTIFEIPMAIQVAIKGMEFAKARRRFSGYVALGCITRGETNHYELMAAETIRGLGDLALRYTIALGNGVLTTENYDQALERASLVGRNLGGKAAETCLEMIKHKGKFALFPRT